MAFLMRGKPPNAALGLRFGEVKPASQGWMIAVLLLVLVPIVTYSQTYDVTKYGAIPNDGKNDTPPIREAINAANNAGGGTVYFPRGIYDINTLALKRRSKGNRIRCDEH